MARYQGMSFETQRMMRDAIDFAKKRRLKQDELEQQKIDAMKSASDSAANAEITKTRMMLDAQKDQAREQRAFEWRKNSDAYDVSSGRMDPALFNMKYGGGAAQSSGAQRTAGDAQGANRQEYMKHLIEAYKAESDAMAGAGQPIPDFSTFMTNNLEAVKSQYPESAPDIDPWELRRQRNAMDAASPITKDFQNNVSMSIKDGAIRFSDQGPRQGETQVGRGWSANTQSALSDALAGKKVPAYTQTQQPAMPIQSSRMPMSRSYDMRSNTQPPPTRSSFIDRLTWLGGNHDTGSGIMDFGGQATVNQTPPPATISRRNQRIDVMTDMQKRDDFGDLTRFGFPVGPTPRTGGKVGMIGSGTPTRSYTDLTSAADERRDPKKRQDWLKLMRLRLRGQTF